MSNRKRERMERSWLRNLVSNTNEILTRKRITLVYGEFVTWNFRGVSRVFFSRKWTRDFFKQISPVDRSNGKYMVPVSTANVMVTRKWKKSFHFTSLTYFRMKNYSHPTGPYLTRHTVSRRKSTYEKYKKLMTATFAIYISASGVIASYPRGGA